MLHFAPMDRNGWTGKVVATGVIIGVAETRMMLVADRLRQSHSFDPLPWTPGECFVFNNENGMTVANFSDHLISPFRLFL